MVLVWPEFDGPHRGLTSSPPVIVFDMNESRYKGIPSRTYRLESVFCLLKSYAEPNRHKFQRKSCRNGSRKRKSCYFSDANSKWNCLQTMSQVSLVQMSIQTFLIQMKLRAGILSIPFDFSFSVTTSSSVLHRHDERCGSLSQLSLGFRWTALLIVGKLCRSFSPKEGFVLQIRVKRLRMFASFSGLYQKEKSLKKSGQSSGQRGGGSLNTEQHRYTINTHIQFYPRTQSLYLLRFTFFLESQWSLLQPVVWGICGVLLCILLPPSQQQMFFHMRLDLTRSRCLLFLCLYNQRWRNRYAARRRKQNDTENCAASQNLT